MKKLFRLACQLTMIALACAAIQGCTGEKSDAESTALHPIPNPLPGLDASKFAASEGCASKKLAKEKLCHLVPVQGEGGIEIGGYPFPKGILKNTFNDEGRLVQSSLYQELKPEVPMIVTDLDYDEQGRIEKKKVATDLNLDNSFDVVDKTLFTYNNVQQYAETGWRSFPSQASKPAEELVNKYEAMSFMAVHIDPVTQITHETEEEVLTVRRFINNSLLIVDDFTVRSENGQLSSSTYRITDCVAKGNCAPTGAAPTQASAAVHTKLEVFQGELRGAIFGVDADANGDTTGPLDNELTCKIRYADGDAAPMLHFPEELKKLGFSGNKVPLAMHCTDKFGNDSSLSWTWKPLWEALGVDQPGK